MIDTIVGYLLSELSEAVQNENYTKQAEIAISLLPFEKIGEVTNKDVIEAINYRG